MPLSSETKSLLITVGARPSPLSVAQVEEVLCELQQFHPHIRFKNLLLETVGDRNQQTSLRNLDKTDFFTKDIDEALLSGRCRIAIHSAKDLPETLPPGIVIVAITKGLDSSDVLILQPGMTLENLPPGAIIGTSTERREKALRKLRSDLTFVDLRGPVHKRIERVLSGELDGIVGAEAAVLRLGRVELNRIRLDGNVAPLQGQLAVASRAGDEAMAELFACIDAR